MATDSDAREHRAFYFGFIAAYVVAVVVAVAVNYLLFADGAYFAFALASKHPWALLWRQFPLRFGTMIVTGGPAGVAAWLGAPAWLVSKLYQATFLLVPLGALWVTRRLERRTAGPCQLWLMFATTTLGMMAFGFPTETFVALALLFPVLAAVSQPIERPGQLVTAMALSTVFLFSHEIATLCAPVLLLALHRASKRPGQDRRYLVALLAWWIVNAVVWLYLKRFFVPENRMLIPALAQNQTALFDLRQLVERPIQRFGLVATAVLIWLTWRATDARHVAVRLAILAIAIWGTMTCLPDTWPSDHYFCRKAIALALPVLGVAAVLAREPRREVGLAAALFLAVQLAVASFNMYGWTQYKRLLVDELHQHPRLLTGDWDAFNQWRLPLHARGFHWNWAEPYLAALLTDDAVMVDNENWYVPMTCATARSVLPGIAWLGADRAAVIVADACEKSPILEPFCAGELTAADVDGDGRIDLVCRENATVTILYAVPRELEHARRWSGQLAWCATPTSTLIVGDFDGDGRADLLCHDSLVGQQRIAFARRDGTFGEPTWPTASTAPWCRGAHAELFAGDLDGDHAADLLCHDRDTGALAARLARGRGDELAFLDAWARPDAGWCTDRGDRFAVADTDGDGLADLLCQRPSDGAVWVAFGHFDRASAALSFGLGDWSSVMWWCTGPRDAFWLHDFDGDQRADMACESAESFLWVSRSTGDRKALFGATGKVRFGAGWCHGGNRRDRDHRLLVDAGCLLQPSK